MSLGMLIDRFGNFLAESAPPVFQEGTYPEEAFPDSLMRVREAFGHHLIPLLLLSSIDGESLPAERQAILRYLLDRAEATGMNLCADEKIALRVYVCEFKPTHAQLTSALKKLHRESKTSLRGLIAAAQAVVDADGERRAREVKFLEDLSRDLAGL